MPEQVCVIFEVLFMVQTFRRVSILLEDPESVSILLDERYRIVDVREVHGLRLPEPGVLKYLLTLLPIILQHVTAFTATEYGATARGTEIVLHPPALAPVYQESPGAVEILPPIRVFLD